MNSEIGKNVLPAKTLHHCFYLIYFLLYHTGGLGCKIRHGNELYYDKWYCLYGYVYRLIYIIALIGGFLYKINDEELNEAMMGILTPVIKIILIFECFICPISYVKVTLYLDYHRHKYVKLANTLQTLDKQLETNFPGIQWYYHKNARKYNSITVSLFGFYTVVCFIYIFNLTHCTCGLVSSVIVSIGYSCLTGAPALAGFLFIGHMDILRIRFRLIRKLLQQHVKHSQQKTYHMSTENVAKFKLLEKFFTQYSCLILTLNDVFCVVSGFGLFHDFALTTSMGYLLCSKALDRKAKVYEYIFIGLFIAPRIFKVITTAVNGYATQKERKNCFHEIIKTEYNFEKSLLLRQPLETFLHWRMHNNNRITVGKILNCNLSLIFLTLNSVVNYIMILIQLQFQQNNIKNRFINNFEIINNDAKL